MNEETTPAQYKATSDRAWDVAKERDAETSALKRRIQQLEVDQRRKLQLEDARQSLQGIGIHNRFEMPTYRGVPLTAFKPDDLIRITKLVMETDR